LSGAFYERAYVNLRLDSNISFFKGSIVSKTTNEYVVEFNHVMIDNFSKVALGGKDPYEFLWNLELDPFS
jgi:hypothetical protein